MSEGSFADAPEETPAVGLRTKALKAGTRVGVTSRDETMCFRLLQERKLRSEIHTIEVFLVRPENLNEAPKRNSNNNIF